MKTIKSIVVKSNLTEAMGTMRQTWYEKIIFKFSLTYWKSVYGDCKYKIKRLFSRITGIQVRENYWDVGYDIVSFALPRIKGLRADKKGHPSCFKDMQEWNDVLDKIIWAMENHDSDTTTLYMYPEGYNYQYRVTEMHDGGLVFDSLDPRTPDTTKASDHDIKVREGMELFGKYLLNLWS
jgi:hypothetical protein